MEAKQIKLNKSSFLKRRHFPGFIKLPLAFEMDQLHKEFSRLSENSCWSDMSHGSALVSDLLTHRRHLAECFQDTNGQYDSYKQIILTDKTNNKNDALIAKESIDPHSLKRYKEDVSLKNETGDEGNYNSLRPFMSEFPQLSRLIKGFGPSLMRARFAKISPGFSIKPHIDYDLTYGIRIHLAFKTNTKSFVAVKTHADRDFIKYHIPVDGHFYFLNTGFKHYAENFGDSDRVHLVLSIRDQSLIKPFRLT